MSPELSKSGPIWSLGTMSGTSLDGVDAAMLLTDGNEILAFGQSDYRPYSDEERGVLRAAMGRWDGTEEAAAIVVAAHGALLGGIVGADLIGFHGQTVAHDPGGRGTRQIGDGRLLAHMLDCPVVWDFRTADVESGGQGAPLAPFFHHACARWMEADEPLAFLNLGGVGNLSWVDPGVEIPSDPGACLAFDTGPANAPINDLMHARLGREMDEGGALAARGRADGRILDRLSAHDWFDRLPPKSLDRDDFAWLLEGVADLGDADAAATLTEAAALCVARGLAQCPSVPARMLVSGGGRSNPVMMAALSERCDCEVVPIETVGLDGDMLEAQAFAYLAVRSARGWPLSAPGTTGVATPTCGGRLSRPEEAVEALSSGGEG
ncbi:anhydro-N-acetylmuramic acid kinase [Palleronia sp. LCG004]|uniref:anhydro-N-acetylmuramic acid kinase n=1 Tax=Palleronia sp. LCG004 TaxID=3079304 RepID=UPI002943EC0C|nr:anhydro-N-acetylmuramic acid kinase [Palleronia sp. LCG004]WOI55031.1 anhydro-N-acetylmuramic acid kinase [Palleronia sp. LCG004]